ncbi:MAG: hypothetical protein LBT78_06070 [Tannerella sp.]|jgi:hypothetical protein|nr:hypothetical protein [Tannerella sp.]
MNTRNLSVILGLAISMAFCGTAIGSAQTLKENLSRKDVLRSTLEKDAVSQAKEEAKEYRADGFRTFIGGLPLDKQLENAWLKVVDIDETGTPEYIVANARVIGGNASAAKMQALHQAKVALAGLIGSNIASLIESSSANEELSRGEAVSLNKALQSSKELIATELGRVVNEVEVYRELPNRNVEVMVCLSYSARLALEIANRALKRKLEGESAALQGKLDEMIKSDTFEPATNTNLIPDAEEAVVEEAAVAEEEQAVE